jgi:hypothetical protein
MGLVVCIRNTRPSASGICERVSLLTNKKTRKPSWIRNRKNKIAP